MPNQKVLVVEDEENLVEALRYNLEREGYAVLTAMDGEKGLELARGSNPDLIILDVMLPRLDGFEVCRILRRDVNTPILMLTAKGEEVDRIVRLELGADDYVTKPFSMRELLARVRAMLRRSRMTSETLFSTGVESYTAGDLEVDLSSHTARLGSVTLDLKPREFDLLTLLVSNRGRPLPGIRYWSGSGDTTTSAIRAPWTYTSAGCGRR